MKQLEEDTDLKRKYVQPALAKLVRFGMVLERAAGKEGRKEYTLNVESDMVKGIISFADALSVFTAKEALAKAQS